MSRLVICKENYMLYDGYQLNTEKAISRYEYVSNKPIKRLDRYVTSLEEEIMQQVDRAITESLGLRMCKLTSNEG